MNRITICKTIIQFIKNYITDPSKLEPHRAKNRFIRSRKLSMLHVIMYLFYSSKASMKKIFPQILSCKTSLSSIDSLFLDACRCRSQILPGRSFRRKKNKAKGRTHFRNLKVSF